MLVSSSTVDRTSGLCSSVCEISFSYVKRSQLLSQQLKPLLFLIVYFFLFHSGLTYNSYVVVYRKRGRQSACTLKVFLFPFFLPSFFLHSFYLFFSTIFNYIGKPITLISGKVHWWANELSQFLFFFRRSYCHYGSTIFFIGSPNMIYFNFLFHCNYIAIIYQVVMNSIIIFFCCTKIYCSLFIIKLFTIFTRILRFSIIKLPFFFKLLFTRI